MENNKYVIANIGSEKYGINITEVQTIEKYLKILDEFEISNVEEFEDNVKDSLAISMALFTILNATIEIGEEIIDEKDLDFQTSYKEIFIIIEKSKLLPKKLCQDLSNFMKQRNMIAQQYDEIENSKIYGLLLKKEIFQEFVDESKKLFL